MEQQKLSSSQLVPFAVFAGLTVEQLQLTRYGYGTF
jgi:hypothetical protein